MTTVKTITLTLKTVGAAFTVFLWCNMIMWVTVCYTGQQGVVSHCSDTVCPTRASLQSMLTLEDKRARYSREIEGPSPETDFFPAAGPLFSSPLARDSKVSVLAGYLLAWRLTHFSLLNLDSTLMNIKSKINLFGNWTNANASEQVSHTKMRRTKRGNKGPG